MKPGQALVSTIAYNNSMNRRWFLLAPSLCLVSVSLAASPLQPTLAEDDVETIFDNGTYRGNFRFHVPVPLKTAWEVLTDFDRMADFVPNVESSRYVSREGNNALVAQRGKLDFGPFTIRYESERRIEMRPAEGVILARAVGGTTKYMQSEMRLLADARGTELNYRVEMIPDRWIPSGIGVGFMRHELAEQFSAIAREMVRRQEGRRTGRAD